jgi:hypothetical protein
MEESDYTDVQHVEMSVWELQVVIFVEFSLLILHVDTASNIRMTVNDELERIWKESIVI